MDPDDDNERGDFTIPLVLILAPPIVFVTMCAVGWVIDRLGRLFD